MRAVRTLRNPLVIFCRQDKINLYLPPFIQEFETWLQTTQPKGVDALQQLCLTGS
jgi:hypothetical protein